MKILIIGDNPAITGGVCNYTRPLFLNLSKQQGVEVEYLYSASRLKNADYQFFSGVKIEKDMNWKGVFKIVNSQNLDRNFDQLLLDIESPENDRVVREFLIRSKPDLIHINEIIGFSSNTIAIARDLGIRVVVSVHEYWWLCPKRVMVDYNRKICSGPQNLKKCSHCMKNIILGHSSRRIKQAYLFQNQLPRLKVLISKVISSFRSAKKNIASVELSFDDEKVPSSVNSLIENDLQKRLKGNIDALNLSDTVLGVSEDVRAHLVRYGVDKNLIKVQHIGSLIAETTIKHCKPLNKDKFIFGFIGGVSYYKGVHQLVEAFLLLPDELKKKSRLEIYGSYNPNYVDSIKNKIIAGREYSNNICFHGRFVREDLENITNSIDVAVLPSLCADTAPQTIFESFSAGLPIIAPQVGGFPDFVKDGVNGLLYEPSNPKSLSEMMAKVLRRPGMVLDFSKHIPSVKTISENAQELVSMYEELTG